MPEGTVAVRITATVMDMGITATVITVRIVNGNVTTMVMDMNCCGTVVVVTNYCRTAVIAVGVMTAAMSAPIAYIYSGTGVIVAIYRIMTTHGQIPCS